MVEAQAMFGLAGVPLVLALVELVKRTLEPAARLVPLISVVIGVGFNLAVGVGLIGVSPTAAALTGLVVGLAASGLYSAGRTVTLPPDDGVAAPRERAR